MSRGSRSEVSRWPVVVLVALALGPLALNVQAQNVVVTTEVSGDAVPDGTVTAKAKVQINDGSVLQSFAWAQMAGVEAMISGANSATATVFLGELSAYKQRLFHVLAEPPIGPAQLPPNVPPPEGEFPGGLQDRFQVVGVNPFALEETGLVLLEVEVVTSSGTYHAEAEIHTAVPWKTAAGIRNVPIGAPVLLHGKDQQAYDWALTVPAGSRAFLKDAMTQNPEFTPDVPGLYRVEVMSEATGRAVALGIFAGTWRGVIVGQNAEGRPVSDGSCLSCHNDRVAPDEFTPWMQTGHAEIFTNNLNTSTHYSSSCFSCHTVGYDSGAANGGFDEASGYQAFMSSGLLNNPGDNWTVVLADFPTAAQLANIQCENCHGPQNASGAHIRGEPRISLSSEVCGTCHGEPLRHARYQQWQLSAHANYELAIDEGESGSCARCHTANGFLAWLPILLGEQAGDPTADIAVTWTADETHPQTCQTCHDPHAIGTTSGDGSNATVRISGDTPPLIAGFTANDVGRGAICMTCHNSRRGLRNDTTFGTFLRTSEAARAPHGSTQTDVLMGQNAYFVPAGLRGSHSMIEDTCVSCHMEKTPPPAVLSYNQGGSNHTFFARKDICSTCHSNLTSEGIQRVVQATLVDLQRLIEEGLLELMDEQIAAGNRLNLGGVGVTDAAEIVEVEFGETRGRQAMTVTFRDGSRVGPLGMTDVDVVPPVGRAVDLYDVANPNLIKAGWNWLLVNSDGSLGVHNFPFVTTALLSAREALLAGGEPCVDSSRTICLNNGRFRVAVDWRSPPAGVPQFRPAQVSNLRTNDSGIFFFDDSSNLEFLIKVLNGCTINNRYWVFFAGTTNVEFMLTVTDTQRDSTRTYSNPMGHPANTVTDTAAFASCP